jgi:protease-4
VGPLEIAARLLRNLLGLLRDAALGPFAARIPRDWIVIPLEHGLVELPPARSWLQALRPMPRALSSVLECFARAREDAAVRGVVLRVGHAQLGFSKVQALERSLAALREAGKQVVVYAESTGNAGAWLGALADRFWMAPEGRLDLLGVRLLSPHLRRALDKLGVRPVVLSAGRYKSAGEILSRDSMSESARESLEPVAEQLYGCLVSGLATSRCSDEDEAKRCIDEGPYLAPEARERGLVDDLVYPDEIPARLAQLQPAEATRGERDPEKRLISDFAYVRLSRPRFRWSPLRAAGDEIAVVALEGAIRPGLAKRLVPLLRRVERRDAFGALVLRVNSPGGDPLSSDLIRHAVSRLAEKKPVVASFADVAASGGYYAAMSANAILAEPTTLTGSIGVVLASAEFDALLEQLGVHIDAVERGRHARIYDPTRRRSEEERALLKRQVERVYQSFVRRVAEARGRSEAEIERVAGGRVWTGAQALEHGLVDGLGGLDEAIARARELAERPDARVVQLRADRHPLERWLRPALHEPTRGAQLVCPVRVTLD